MQARPDTKTRVFVALLLVLLAAPALMAADPDTAAHAATVEKHGRTLGEFIHAGGGTMYILIAMSAFALFLALYYLFTLRAYPAEFIGELESAAKKNDLEGMIRICEAHSCMASRVIRSALDQMSIQDMTDYMIVSSALEDEGSRQASFLWQRIQYLLDVGVIAPMVGLMGTVLGMLQAFSGLQMEIGGVIPLLLAQGLSKSMVTTIGGLAVGIPAMVLFAFFRGRVMRLVAESESVCGGVMRKFIMARRAALEARKK